MRHSHNGRFGSRKQYQIDKCATPAFTPSGSKPTAPSVVATRAGKPAAATFRLSSRSRSAGASTAASRTSSTQSSRPAATDTVHRVVRPRHKGRDGRAGGKRWTKAPPPGRGGVRDMSRRATVSADWQTITVHVPFRMKKRGGRKLVVTPDGGRVGAAATDRQRHGQDPSAGFRGGRCWTAGCMRRWRTWRGRRA